MAIVFVHGVAVREPDDPQHATVERLTRGAEWPAVEAALREYVAPAVRPIAPAAVDISFVYWGDLGAPVPLEVEEPGSAYENSEHLDDLTRDELGHALEERLRAAYPPSEWPAVVTAVWRLVDDPALRSQLAARSVHRQRSWLDKQLRAAVTAESGTLDAALASVGADLAARGRATVRTAMAEVRRPFHGVVPVFVGDVLRYLDGRGRPGEPGPVMRRVLDALVAAGAASRATGEPLVVLTHSMGGQLVYDALTSFAADAPGGGSLPFVDLWCSAGGQVGLFAQLGVFLDAQGDAQGDEWGDARGDASSEAGGDAGAGARAPVASPRGLPPERLGYFWNAWSSSDVLSFPAEGRVAGAHDADFAYAGAATTTHLAYLKDPAFYRTLAAKVAAHCPQPR